MFLLTEPSTQVVTKFIARQRESTFSYAEVGATHETPPPGYTIDHNRIQLGSGEQDYQRAVAALRDCGNSSTNKTTPCGTTSLLSLNRVIR